MLLVLVRKTEVVVILIPWLREQYGRDTCRKVAENYMQGNSGCKEAAPAAAWFGESEMWHGDYHNMHRGITGGGNDTQPNPHVIQIWYHGDTCGK
eukprot:8550068-Ditylum_brightwellii.AAC.1